ncbi:putative disease resistance RPP13-like protein 1 [Fagus crenata]
MSIKECEELANLPRILMVDDSLEQGREFPCLLELSIWTCRNLRELPRLFPSLAIIVIDGCQELTELPRLPSIRELEVNKFDEGVLQSIIDLTSLNYLRICQISKLTCFLEGFFQRLTALEELQIVHLGDLTTLSNEIGLQNLQCLQRLEISGCPFLKELPQMLYKLSSLKELRVSNCPSLVHCFADYHLPNASDDPSKDFHPCKKNACLVRKQENLDLRDNPIACIASI